ncbi:2-hydroxyglutaryl-CoA dehydratase [Clostridium fermenticellae]|uniref:2-hydroxyglutaryl-CoA dehydratase n=1 Tax=Clostridium fermenticellae TaxID=2068654 RepID=A0A386H3Y8_9CLOT|nr:2-hydroxyglutaryl-CoA dehydratase [Clostridium fermenticellae]AYD40288.1 2-hydroxyglutaryl-CoA dehydratase [Clostridium fermenticellae]
MKITFPHFGYTYLAVKAIFDGLGIDYIIPPINNKTAIEIGTKYSPEEICLPFKIMIGNYIQSIEQGADTILIIGSCGPCRFGEYCELQKNILKKLGYDLDIVVLDTPSAIGIKELLNRIYKISDMSKVSTKEKLKTLYTANKIINLLDRIEKNVHMRAGYEIKKGWYSKIFHDCINKAYKCNTPNSMLALLEHYDGIIRKAPIDNTKTPLKIAIIGEIYTIIEPFANLYIEDKLMEYEVCSYRRLSPSWWIKNTLLSIFNLNSIDIKKSSKKYIPLPIGGYAKECIGEAVIAKKNGFDGAIQIFPMGCMPEIVSKSILPSVSKDNDFPVMTLIVDEMTGEAGYMTRIEAFLDLLERRREKNVSHGS